jgi:hypothetical protein
MQAWATAEALLVRRSARRFDDISECCFGSNSDKHELFASDSTLKVSGIAWAWAVQVGEMQSSTRASFDYLLQHLLLTMYQCSLHQLACSPSFVAWTKEATEAAGRGDMRQVGQSSSLASPIISKL